MSDEPNPISDADLHAWVDGELDPARRIEVEAWLAGHPEAVAQVRDYQAIGQRLHERFDGVLSEPVQTGPNPGSRSGQATRPRPALARAAAAAGLLLLGGLLGWSLHGRSLEVSGPQVSEHLPKSPMATVQADLMRPAVFAHQVYAGDTRYPVEIPSVRRASLDRWVSQRMRAELRAPDLSAIELRYVGGRLLPSTNRMAAQFMYEDADGRRVTVYVRRISDAQQTGVHYSAQQALRAFYWIDGTMGYAVIGEQSAGELVAIADAVKSAFAAGAAADEAVPR